MMFGKKYKVLIYRQAHNSIYYELDLYKNDIDEYMLIPCQECNDGIFYITNDDFFQCVECRGIGKKWTNMY